MQDPSYGVAQQLQNHVHLISNHRYPLQPSLNLDAAYNYLHEAPVIVKQVAAMAWQYVQTPQDGTIWLEWISPRGGEHRFASDGYVWGDQEQARREDFAGYTVEILTHTIGYRPSYDHMATHARTRYHLVAKHPSVNNAPPDPNLWIVHYHATDQSRWMPYNAVPIHPQMRQQIGERRWLETQGRIERKEFMLHDREHWPHVTLPGQMPPQHGGHPGMNPMLAQQQLTQARHPSHPWPQAAGQGPPAKRPRHSGPSGAPGASDGVVDTSIEDEENVSLGDYFDHLSQRDISTARYMQHHRWMEEIFSSPYASSQIVPPDLGLGLMGALKGLTDGILDPPSLDEINAVAPKPPKAKEATRFTNLRKEQVEEFNSRVQKHLEAGQAEIERMKKEHAERMAELRKGSVLMQAEKRLRNAAWRDREQLDQVYRLDGIADGDGPRGSVEDIIKEVEDRLRVRITGYGNVSMVEKGGLEEKEERSRDDFFTDGSRNSSEGEDAPMQGVDQPLAGVANGSASAAAAGSQQGPSTTAMETQAHPLQPKAPQDMPQPNFEGSQQHQSQDQPSGQHEQDQPELGRDDDMFGDGTGMDMSDGEMMEGMGMDIDVDNGGIETGNIDFLDDPEAEVADVETAAQADVPAPVMGEETNVTAPAAAPETATGGAGIEQQQQQPQPTSLPPATTAPDVPAAPAPGTDQSTTADLFADPNIPATTPSDSRTPGAHAFPDTTFDDLAAIDNGADDLGDVDFGMDDSAFEGAMHGMEDPTAEDDLGGDADDDGTGPGQEAHVP